MGITSGWRRTTRLETELGMLYLEFGAIRGHNIVDKPA